MESKLWQVWVGVCTLTSSRLFIILNLSCSSILKCIFSFFKFLFRFLKFILDFSGVFCSSISPFFRMLHWISLKFITFCKWHLSQSLFSFFHSFFPFGFFFLG